MILFWVFVLAVSMLLYVLLDGFDLGIGILFGVTRDEARRRTMMSAVAPIWDGNETWLVSYGRGPLGRLPDGLCDSALRVLSSRSFSCWPV